MFDGITVSFTDLDRRGAAQLELERHQRHLEIDSVRVQDGLAPTAWPASGGQLPPVAQTLQSHVVSLTVPEETPKEVMTYAAPTKAPLALMLPDGAIAEETDCESTRGETEASDNRCDGTRCRSGVDHNSAQSSRPIPFDIWRTGVAVSCLYCRSPRSRF